MYVDVHENILFICSLKLANCAFIACMNRNLSAPIKAEVCNKLNVQFVSVTFLLKSNKNSFFCNSSCSYSCSNSNLYLFLVKSKA